MANQHRDEQFDPDDPQKLWIFSKKALIAVGIAVAVISLMLFVWATAWVLLLAFAGILLAVFLRGFAQMLHRVTKLPLHGSFAVVALVFFGLLGGGSYFLGAEVARRVDDLSNQIPQGLNYVQNQIERYSWGQTVINYAREIKRSLLTNGSETAGQALAAVFGGITGIVVIFFLGLYFGADPHPYTEGIARLVPEGQRPQARDIMDSVGDTLWNWLAGMIAMMIIIALFTAIGLAAIGMPMPVTLGIIAGLCAFVPNFGPLIGSLPGLLLAAPMGPEMVLMALAVYVGVQLIESYLITPLIQHKMVKLPPAITILSQVLMGVLMGGLGVVLAVPLAAVVVVLVKEVYIKGMLGDHVEEPERKPESS